MSCQINPNRTWIRALKYFDGKDLDRSLYAFEMMPRTPRIYFNMGMIHAGLGDYSSAISCFRSAISDRLASAVEYFQLGALLFSSEDYEQAQQMFSVAYLLMNGRPHLDLKPVGLDYCLYSCEILFNCAMSLLHLGKFEEGTSMLAAAREKQQYKSQIPCSREVFTIPELDSEVGPSAPRGDYWTVYQVPHRTLYRPVNQTTDPFLQKSMGIRSADGISSCHEKQTSNQHMGSHKSTPVVFSTSRKRAIPFIQ